MTKPVTGSIREGLQRRLSRQLVSQFHHPRGLLGRLAGQVLAHRPSNRERNRFTVELLEIQPEHRVLELGYGPGLAIEDCARRAARGRVVGVDHSETMRKVALSRNARAVRDGRVELHAASMDELEPQGSLGDLGGDFDRIFAVNAVQFARNGDAVIRSLVARLRPGGWLAVTAQPRRPGATSEDSLRSGEETRAAFQRAGLTKLRSHLLPLEPAAAVCVIGERSADLPA